MISASPRAACPDLCVQHSILVAGGVSSISLSLWLNRTLRAAVCLKPKPHPQGLVPAGFTPRLVPWLTNTCPRVKLAARTDCRKKARAPHKFSSPCAMAARSAGNLARVGPPCTAFLRGRRTRVGVQRPAAARPGCQPDSCKRPTVSASASSRRLTTSSLSRGRTLRPQQSGCCVREVPCIVVHACLLQTGLRASSVQRLQCVQGLESVASPVSRSM